MKILVITFLFLCIISSINAACNSCSLMTGISCTSLTQYQACINGLPDTTQTFGCPSGMICQMDVICAPNNTLPSCGSCGVCNSRLYACVDINKFQFCFGVNNTMSGQIGTCPTGTICDFNAIAPSFCTTMGMVTPTCTGPFTPPTNGGGTNTTVTPTAWCQTNGQVGRFPILSDKTCLTYYNCFLNIGVIKGQIYKCPGTTIFNDKLGKCVDPLTYTCTH